VVNLERKSLITLSEKSTQMTWSLKLKAKEADWKLALQTGNNNSQTSRDETSEVGNK
jgi:hypothetical protein